MAETLRTIKIRILLTHFRFILASFQKNIYLWKDIRP